jgi:hypothetical protein
MVQPYFYSYSVKIIDKPFYAGKDIAYPSTAIVTFFNSKGQLLFAKDYGHISTKQIYDRIESEKSLNLDYCYVNNFSFTAYRRMHLLDKKEYISLKHISAKQAFFHSDYSIDFSYIEIENSDVNFSECCFASGDLSFVNAKFGDGDVDFSYALFRGSSSDFSNAHFGNGNVIFKNAIFLGGFKNFQYTDFGKGEISFINTEFGDGEVSFLNTHFNEGDVSFKVARFGNGKIDFHFAKFQNGDISFERTEFGSGMVDFRTIEFGKGKVNFNRAVFGDGDITFEASAADGRITFKKTIFGNGNLSFELAEFEKTELNLEKATFGECNVSFYNGRFEKIILDGCQINHYLDMRVRKCPDIDLSDTIIRDIVDFKPHEFDVDIDVLDISAMRLLGTIYIDWHNNNVHKIISNQKNTTLAEKAEQFRVLKMSFNATGQYGDEDISYVWFKRYELKAEYEQLKKQNKLKLIIEAPIHYFKKIVFDYAGLYATNPLRVMFSMVTVYAAFSLFYSIVLALGLGGIVSGLTPEHNAIGIIGRSFFFSGITFLTIGYGDFYPMGLIRVFSVIEGFTGVFLMSYFTVAFVRKILR